MVVNYAAILVASVVSMAIGMYWYSRKGFGKQWLKLQGISMKDAEKMHKGKMAKCMVGGFIVTIVTAYVLSMFNGMLNANTAMAGATIAFWAWLGFAAPVEFGSVLWENRKVKLFYINAAHTLVSMVVMGAILAVWG